MLESVATRIRNTTVDRAAGWAMWTAVGIVLAMMGFVLVVFFLIALFRAVAELVGSATIAYAIFGGLFLLLGAFLWSKRIAKEES